jgi:DNA-binding FadR family transcriptional regulator
MTDQEVEELGEILREQQEVATTASALPREPVSVVQADRFHHAIHVGARSPRLITLLEQIYAQVTHFRNLTLRQPGRAVVSAAGHAKVYDAIQRRRSREADRQMRAHIDDARQALVRSLREAPRARPEEGQAHQPVNAGGRAARRDGDGR